LLKVLGKTLPTRSIKTIERIEKNYAQNIRFNFTTPGNIRDK
jgi:hypothetical protein